MAQRIEQLITSHKDLTNAVSHELRTPIARLRFSLEMLQNSTDEEKQRYYQQELETDIRELEDLVTELLTYAKFDREKPEMIFVSAPLKAYLEELIVESNPKGSTVAIELQYHIQPASRAIAYEPKQLARALGNLIQNGLSFSEKKIEVTAELHGNHCVIHVDDDGPGIDKDMRDKILEPFVRLDGSRSRMTGGYGLGLAIVNRIMQWHRGSVEVAGSALGGARFSLIWPIHN
jgi:signal transduction histidine kinase